MIATAPAAPVGAVVKIKQPEQLFGKQGDMRAKTANNMINKLLVILSNNDCFPLYAK